MEKLQDTLDSLTEEIKQIRVENEQLNLKVLNVEAGLKESKESKDKNDDNANLAARSFDNLNLDGRPSNPLDYQQGRSQVHDVHLPGLVSDPFIEVQSEFTALKDTLTRVKLDSDLKVPDSRVGVRPQFSHQCSVIQRCAKYAETSVKIISLLQDRAVYDLQTSTLTPTPRPVTQQDLRDLAVVGVAQLRFLQEEFASIVVESQYNHDAAQTFRSLQRNVSVFPPSVIDKVETAVNLSALKPPRADRGRGGFRGGYYRGNYQNQRGSRGGYRGGRGRGFTPPYYNSGYNPYAQYAYNTVPETNPGNTDQSA